MSKVWRTEIRETRVLAAKTCNKCGRSFDEDDSHQWLNPVQSFSCDIGLTTSCSFELCGSCVDLLLKSFEVPADEWERD